MRKLKNRLFILFCILLFSNVSFLHAQKISTFQLEYFIKNGFQSRPDVPLSIFQLPDKGFLCLEISYKFIKRPFTYNFALPTVVRFDSAGRELWMKQYFSNSFSTAGSDEGGASNMVRVSDSTFVFCGNTGGTSGDSSFLIKIDMDGNILWSRIYKPSPGLGALDKTSDGGFIMDYVNVPSSKSRGPGFGLVKTDDTGKVMWAKQYYVFGELMTELDILRIINAPGGGYYFLGGVSKVKNKTEAWQGYFICKISKTGNLEWNRNFSFWVGTSGSGAAEIGSITTTHDAIYFIGAPSSYFTASRLIKMDTSGHIEWVKDYKKNFSPNNTITYDSVRNELVLATGGLTKGDQYFSRMDTSGNFKGEIHLYPNTYNNLNALGSYPATSQPNTFIRIPNGFAMITPCLEKNGGCCFIKTDTAGSTGGCDTLTQSPPVSDTTQYSTSIPTLDSVVDMNLTSYSVDPAVEQGFLLDSVLCPPFFAQFRWKDTCAYSPTFFYDSTYADATGWKWDFGDPSSGKSDTSSAKNPAHIYKKGGQYKVTLIASNGRDYDTISRDVTIAAAPDLIVKDTIVCAGDSVNLAAAPGTSYLWNNGGILASNDSITQGVTAYPYKDTLFKVGIINSFGCAMTDTFKLKINAKCSGSSELSGIINHYASALTVDSCQASITVDTVSYFKPGDTVMIMEMKGAIIDTSNTAGFGTIKNIGNAGKYEYNAIDSIGGSTVYFKYKFENKYDDAPGEVQLITVPVYHNVLITDTLKAMPWNGNKGGVLVLNATGNVILGAAVDVSGEGFKGGGLDSGGINCRKNDYFYDSSSTFGARKGEGIAITSPNFAKGRGSNASGGGGGNSFEAGGGGGSNDTIGGNGGNEFAACGADTNGGAGGVALHRYTAQGRIFAGGGGGAGYCEYLSASPGTNGGGIIMITAPNFAGNSNRIIANGASQNQTAKTDGAGGGGAGGSIDLNITSLPTKLSVFANGGNGGNSGYRVCTGPGGGGSGGVILLHSTSLPSNMKLANVGGLSGVNNNNASSCYLGTYGANPGQNGSLLTGFPSQQQSNTISKRPYTTIISASVLDSGHVEVSFTKDHLPNVIGYKIYRQINNGAFVDVGTLKHPATSPVKYIDTINTAKDSFSYHVYTLDTCGDLSNYSAKHTTIHLNDTVKGCEQAIYLNWNPYAGWPVKKYEVYRSMNGGAENLFATVSANIEAFKDTIVNYHDSYCYRVLAIDTSLKDSSWSEKICENTYFPDTAKVITVTKTVTSVANGTVIIRWQSVTGQKYMSGTELYYSSDGKTYALLATLPITQDSFMHNGINTQTSDGFYYVKNIDSCGSVSDSSIIHKTMTLIVSVGELLHKLNWTPYEGFKVKTYKIEKLIGGNFQVIDSVSGTDTSTKYFPAPCNHVERYRIEAIGYNPGEVSLSDSMGRKAIDTIPPNAAKITSLAVLNSNMMQLKFISSDSPNVYTYVVQRAINGTWGTVSDFISHLHGVESSYVDTINTTTNNLCYTIITLDSCLNVAQSDTICSESLSGNALSCKAEVSLLFPKIITPPTAPDSLVVYRSVDKINYNKIKELPTSASTYVDSSVSAGIHYNYKLEGIYHQANMGSYSDTFGIIPRIIPDADTAQIVYATVIKSDEVKGAIYINWKRAALNDTNARGYYLYSFNSTNGKYALLKDITDLNDTTFINSDINTIKNIFKYYVITYNVCDVGINSNIHRTILLNVQGKNLTEQLNWIYYLGVPVKNYSIYKSVDGGLQNLVKNIGTDSSYLDSNITCNHNITYQIQAILANGEISFSDSVTVKSYDSIRPKTGPIVVATVTKTGTADGMISLMWNGAIDNNLEGYDIYRSSDGFYWISIQKNYAGTSFVDTGLNTYRQSYYYKIQPVDSCGNTGPYTIYHETIDLIASSGNGYNLLSWNGYVGWQVKKYLVYRDGILIDTASNNVFKFKDTAIICHTIYQYLIKAVDSVNDTIISASNTDSAKAANHIPPQKVYIKTVTVSKPNKAASISWTPSKSYDVKDYMVYRKSAATGDMKLLDSTINTNYIDSFSSINGNSGINKINGSDCYYIFARDHCGNISDGSNEGCIIILDAKNQQGYNQLSWNSYQHWPDGVQSYNVYKNEDSTGWQLIGVASPLTPLPGRGEFDDKKLGDSTIDFCYQVEAIENPGQYNQLSRSTVECVHQDATVFIPNSFTPYNQDGVNDLFGPKGVYIKSYDMRIYNRWGECVYASPASSRSIGTGSPSGEGAGWDGTFRGQPVQQGIYIYMITVTDYNGKQSYFKGTVTLFQ